MKNRYFKMGLMFFSAALLAGSAIADNPRPIPVPPHRPVPPYRPVPPPIPVPVPVPDQFLRLAETLFRQSDQLNSQVQYSYINATVKHEVRWFRDRSYDFYLCVQRGGVRPGYGRYDHPTPPYPPVRPYCDNQFIQVQSAFGVVEQRLWDIQYQFPAIYREFLQTRVAFQRVSEFFGPTYPGDLRVTGMINNRAFSFVGRSNYDIESQCLNFGNYHSIYWVDHLMINDRFIPPPAGYHRSIQSVCQLIANSAAYR